MGISRPTGNKNDVKRLGPNLYAPHIIHVLEKTQRKCFYTINGLIQALRYPNGCLSSASLFCVRPVRENDRQTCCCRYHVEVKTVFKSCAAFGNNLSLQQEDGEDGIRQLQSLTDTVDATLCDKYVTSHNPEYLERKCTIVAYRIFTFFRRNWMYQKTHLG